MPPTARGVNKDLLRWLEYLLKWEKPSPRRRSDAAARAKSGRSDRENSAHGQGMASAYEGLAMLDPPVSSVAGSGDSPGPGRETTILKGTRPCCPQSIQRVPFPSAGDRASAGMSRSGRWRKPRNGVALAARTEINPPLRYTAAVSPAKRTSPRTSSPGKRSAASHVRPVDRKDFLRFHHPDSFDTHTSNPCPKQ